MWIDRFFYRLYHPEVPDDGKVHVGFCPEGCVKPSDVLKAGDWTKEVIGVETRYKKATEALERRWALKFREG